MKIEELEIGELYNIYIPSSFWLIRAKEYNRVRYMGVDGNQNNYHLFIKQNTPFGFYPRQLKNIKKVSNG